MPFTRTHLLFLAFLARLSCSHNLTFRDPEILSPEEGPKGRPMRDYETDPPRPQAATGLRDKFGDALFPVRLMVTLGDSGPSFLELGAALGETVEPGPVARFDHLAHADSYMIELTEECTMEQLNTLVKEIEDLGGLVEYDELAYPVSDDTQGIASTQSDRLDDVEHKLGWRSRKFHPNQWYIPEMNVDKAWNALEGVPTREVRVCVIDSGVDYLHRGLKGRLVTEKPMPKKGTPDDDVVLEDNGGDEESEEIVSANFVDDNADAMDHVGHGTHIAGVIASNIETSKVAGINPNARIIPCKAFDNRVQVRVSNIVQCIDFCLYAGAEIQNHSWMVTKELTFLKRAFESAYRMDVIMVVAAGNFRTLKRLRSERGGTGLGTPINLDIDEMKQFPASYSRMFPNVVATANLMLLDRRKSMEILMHCSWSSPETCRKRSNLILNEDSMYGFGSVQLAAPGTRVYSLFLANTYAFSTGTSVSTAVVTGVVSLIRSVLPRTSGNFRKDCVRTIQILRESVKLIPSLYHKVGWKGSPDCLEAVNLSKALLRRPSRRKRTEPFTSPDSTFTDPPD